MITQNADQTRFPIRILAEKTRVGTSTLRAWERRYGLLHPERTPKGHRLYSEADAKLVLKVLDLLNDGHSLPAIAQMLINNNNSKHPAEISSTQTDGAVQSSEMGSIWEQFIESTLEATHSFNIERIDAVYNEASSLYPIEMVTDRLILPTLTILGEAWIKQPEQGIGEEHFYTSWLKNRLGARFHHAYSQARGARILCACVPGCYHEIGLMLFSLSALSRGYRVLYFGADLPLNQLPYISQRSAAKALVLSVHNQLKTEVSNELSSMIPKLPSAVFIGGHTASIDTGDIESAGGILLGNNISVAIRVFESHIPAYPATSK